MKRTSLIAILILTSAWMIAQATGGVEEPAALPVLDGQSAKGLHIECQPTHAQFIEGSAAVIRCTITNTSASLKPFGWDIGQSPHYEFVQNNATGSEVIRPIPTARLRLDKPVTIVSKDWPHNNHSGYVLFIPPNESITLYLSYIEGNPGIIRGQIMYDPVGMRSTILPQDKLDLERVYSNEFEYEVVQDPQHSEPS